MSSEEEVIDEHGAVQAFKISRMIWRKSDSGMIMRKLDAIKRETQDTRGAKAAPRQTGGPTLRKAVLNLPHQYYERTWLETAIDEGLTVVKEGRGKSKWMDFSSWESSLSRH